MLCIVHPPPVGIDVASRLPPQQHTRLSMWSCSFLKSWSSPTTLSGLQWMMLRIKTSSPRLVRPRLERIKGGRRQQRQEKGSTATTNSRRQAAGSSRSSSGGIGRQPQQAAGSGSGSNVRKSAGKTSRTLPCVHSSVSALLAG